MINDGGIRFLLLNKGHNFSSKTKFPLKYTHDLLKLKLQTWDDSLAPFDAKVKVHKKYTTLHSEIQLAPFDAKLKVHMFQWNMTF